MPTPHPGTAAVDAYMRELEHPHKEALAAVRAIILGANGRMAERIKWKVPSFYYRADFAAFHPRTRDRLHLVLVFPHGLVPDPHGIMAGDYRDRRMVYFADLAEVRARAGALAAIVNAWVALEEERA